MDYSQASSQQINLYKCKFYTAKASPRKNADIASYLGFSPGCLPFNYLGVPLFIGKPRRVHLQPIADTILNKLTTWKGACLSIMGRVELVKSIIQSMLVYTFHIYKWPSQLLNLIDKGIRNFVWSGDIDKKKLVTVAWAKVCTPTKARGLGI